MAGSIQEVPKITAGNKWAKQEGRNGTKQRTGGTDWVKEAQRS